MIVHVVRQAEKAKIGEVVVATDSKKIADAVEEHGGSAVMTNRSHKSGSDRIYEAIQKIDPKQKIKVVINLQGDLPNIKPQFIREVVKPLKNRSVGLATLAVRIKTEAEKNNQNIVKVVGTQVGGNVMRAIYFTRAKAPWGNGPMYHHIGIYAWKRNALRRFVGMSASKLEKQEKLEQLRAIENNMRCDVAVVDSTPVAVDTLNDLKHAKKIMEK